MKGSSPSPPRRRAAAPPWSVTARRWRRWPTSTSRGTPSGSSRPSTAVLAQAGEHRGSLEGLSCDVGPGSFTGVRVGVASAKGIALGLGLPLAGVVSLEAMAAAAFATGAAGPGDVVVAAVDAKKSEVFVAAYDARGTVLAAPCARTLGPEAFTLVTAPPGGRLVVVGEVARDPHAAGGRPPGAGSRARSPRRELDRAARGLPARRAGRRGRGRAALRAPPGRHPRAPEARKRDRLGVDSAPR